MLDLTYVSEPIATSSLMQERVSTESWWASHDSSFWNKFSPFQSLKQSTGPSNSINEVRSLVGVLTDAQLHYVFPDLENFLWWSQYDGDCLCATFNPSLITYVIPDLQLC